jgi:hypothetical protein
LAWELAVGLALRGLPIYVCGGVDGLFFLTQATALPAKAEFSSWGMWSAGTGTLHKFGVGLKMRIGSFWGRISLWRL